MKGFTKYTEALVPNLMILHSGSKMDDLAIVCAVFLDVFFFVFGKCNVNREMSEEC